jgi:hypothetical protein
MRSGGEHRASCWRFLNDDNQRDLLDSSLFEIILTGQIGSSVKLLNRSVDKRSSERAPFVFNLDQLRPSALWKLRFSGPVLTLISTLRAPTSLANSTAKL